MAVLSIRLACATASMTSTVSLGQGPRSSTVMAISGGYALVAGAAQIRPINVRAQVFAAHCTVGSFLNFWAMFGGYLARSPIGYDLRRLPYQFSKSRKASCCRNCLVDLVDLFHIDILNTAFSKGNRYV